MIEKINKKKIVKVGKIEKFDLNSHKYCCSEYHENEDFANYMNYSKYVKELRMTEDINNKLEAHVVRNDFIFLSIIESREYFWNFDYKLKKIK